MMLTSHWGYTLQPLALEILGLTNESAIQFFEDLGHRISAASNESTWGHFSSKMRLCLLTLCLSVCTDVCLCI